MRRPAISRFQNEGVWLLWRSGGSDLSRKLLVGDGRFVLEFHNVVSQYPSDIESVQVPGLTKVQFATILEWLSKRFPFLSVETFLKGDVPGVLLTFDDGLVGNYTEVLPLLEYFAAPAVFFVATQHVRDPHNWLPANRRLAALMWPDGAYDAYAHALFDGMSEEQLSAAGQHPLITIGSHTVTHPFLTSCDDAALTHELLESRRYLEAITGQVVNLFAYPTGDYDRRVAEAVRAAGYQAAFVETARNVGLPVYEIPRVGIYRDDPAYLSFKLSGLHQAALKKPYA